MNPRAIDALKLLLRNRWVKEVGCSSRATSLITSGHYRCFFGTETPKPHVSWICWGHATAADKPPGNKFQGYKRSSKTNFVWIGEVISRRFATICAGRSRAQARSYRVGRCALQERFSNRDCRRALRLRADPVDVLDVVEPGEPR